MSDAAPVSMAVVNDHELVVRGVAAMLKPHQDRITVVELDSDVPVSQPVDIALYDAFTNTALTDPNLRTLTSNPKIGRVVLYTWQLDEPLLRLARSLGVAAALAKSLPAAELAADLVRIHHGQGELLPINDQPERVMTGGWPGREHGLTAREAEVIALVTSGLSNQEIAQRLHLSINSVKAYIRSAYQTMGVTSRSQAVLWGIDHSMRPQIARVLNRAG